MGVRASQTGVTLLFFNPDGTPDTTKAAVTGEFAAFYSISRPVDPTSNDLHLGSKDWLTDIMVVDSQVKLGNMTPTQSGIQLTSAASKQVLVRWDVGGQRGTQVECFTISSGQMVGTRLFADTIKVLPRNTVMDENNNDLWGEWTKAAQSLLTQATSPAVARSAKTPSAGPASPTDKRQVGT
jgi:hypothetical protein